MAEPGRAQALGGPGEPTCPGRRRPHRIGDLPTGGGVCGLLKITFTRMVCVVPVMDTQLALHEV